MGSEEARCAARKSDAQRAGDEMPDQHKGVRGKGRNARSQETVCGLSKRCARKERTAQSDEELTDHR